jgi:hypothetical protein
MLKSTLITGAVALALFAIGPQAAEDAGSSADQAVLATDSPISAVDGFPSKEMELRFNDYLAWTKAQGLSRLVAFEPRAGAADVLPNPAMRDVFEDYLKWAVEIGHGPYYAFTLRNFD